MTSYAGFGGFGCGMLVLIFCCHLLGVCVCVCLGLDQCFRGSTECAGDGFLEIID